LAAWRRLRVGASATEVRSLLGDPTRVIVKVIVASRVDSEPELA
jgi:hypothetical protein